MIYFLTDWISASIGFHLFAFDMVWERRAFDAHMHIVAVENERSAR